MPLLRRDRKASTAIVVALCLTMLLAFAALAIDFTYLRIVQLQAQNAADAAAYAGMVALRETNDADEAVLLGELVAAEHTVGGAPAIVTMDVGEWDFDTESYSSGGAAPNSVSATVIRSQGDAGGPIAFIGPALGWDFTQVSADATAAIQPRDILFIVDQSGSMYRAMSYAQEGLQAAVDVVVDSDPNGLDRVAIVGFSEGGFLHMPLTNASDNYATITADITNELSICGYDNYSYYYDNDWSGDAWNDPYDSSDDSQHDWESYTNRPMSPGDYGWGGSAHAELVAPCCWPYCNTSTSGGSTNTAGAVEVAADEMIANARPTAYKLIVFLGDGMPNCSYTRYYAGQCTGTSGVIADTHDELDTAWNNYIHVTTMFYSASPNPTAIALFEDFVRGDGVAYYSNDVNEFVDMFEAAVRTNVALVE